MENHLVQELAPVLGGFPFTPDSEGYLTLHLPRMGGNEEVPFIAIGDDYGDLVHGVFLNPEKWNCQLIQGISHSTPQDDLTSSYAKGVYSVLHIRSLCDAN